MPQRVNSAAPFPISIPAANQEPKRPLSSGIQNAMQLAPQFLRRFDGTNASQDPDANGTRLDTKTVDLIVLYGTSLHHLTNWQKLQEQ